MDDRNLSYIYFVHYNFVRAQPRGPVRGMAPDPASSGEGMCEARATKPTTVIDTLVDLAEDIKSKQGFTSVVITNFILLRTENAG